MKRFDADAHAERRISKESRIATVIALCEGQLRGLEDVLEGQTDIVLDPGAYNQVASLLDQVRYWVPTMFLTPRDNLKNVEDGVSFDVLLGQTLNEEPEA